MLWLKQGGGRSERVKVWVFNLLCAPCFAAMGAIKREMNNGKWFWSAIGYQCLLAYVAALCIYQIGTWVTAGTFGFGTLAALVLAAVFFYLLLRPRKETSGSIYALSEIS